MHVATTSPAVRTSAERQCHQRLVRPRSAAPASSSKSTQLVAFVALVTAHSLRSLRLRQASAPGQSLGTAWRRSLARWCIAWLQSHGRPSCASWCSMVTPKWRARQPCSVHCVKAIAAFSYGTRGPAQGSNCARCLFISRWARSAMYGLRVTCSADSLSSRKKRISDNASASRNSRPNFKRMTNSPQARTTPTHPATITSIHPYHEPAKFSCVGPSLRLRFLLLQRRWSFA
mmetsp:Transcript_53193/g.146925  ORF Transcript_53193/g.146925 Transcript_53193/m.146925 type:complete len:231 (+) Transcript_53193:783-1475(+)